MVLYLTDLREEILREFHCSRFTMHLDGIKMYQDLRRQYYWRGMKRHVGDFVRRCLTCQQVKAEHQKPVGLLQPLEVAEWQWEHVTMDFVTHLPRTQQMAPYEALYGRPCRSPLCWTEVGESSITGPDLIRDTSEKVSLI